MATFLLAQYAAGVTIWSWLFVKLHNFHFGCFDEKWWKWNVSFTSYYFADY